MNRCVFCEIGAKQTDTDLTVYEDTYVYAQVSLYQKMGNHGHVLVIPRQHEETIYDLDDQLDAPLMNAIRLLSLSVKLAFSAEGVMVKQNNEPAAGQDVAHLYFHIIPRFENDNFEAKSYFKLEINERLKLAEALKDTISDISAATTF